MKEKIITDNASEQIVIKWDGIRFALCSVRTEHELEVKRTTAIIILNPKEMLDIVKFAGILGEE